MANSTELFQPNITEILTSLPSFLKVITETDLFQRLKKIKQLGLCLVFPQVNHSRYDHSIGTWYLANKLMDCLEINSKIKIQQLYRECVQIAALLHDIGHGPWSHFWEQNINKNVKHELNCKLCVDNIFGQPEVFKEQSDVFKDKSEFAVQFIKSLIIGEKLNSLEYKDLKQFEFLYEIINNKHEDIDVDRWDYLKRDFYNANNSVDYPEFRKQTIELDFEEIFTNATISEDRAHINYDKKSIQAFFKARQNLHVQLYTHPTTKLYERLLARAIKRADEIKLILPKFNGKLMREVNFKDDTFNIEEIKHLNDEYIFDELKSSEDPEIKRLIHYIENAKTDNELRETIKKPFIYDLKEYALIEIKDKSPSEYIFDELKNSEDREIKRLIHYIENAKTDKELRETIKKPFIYDFKDYALIEIKVKSPSEKMSKFNLDAGSATIQNGIHELHAYNVTRLLEYNLSE